MKPASPEEEFRGYGTHDRRLVGGACLYCPDHFLWHAAQRQADADLGTSTFDDRAGLLLLQYVLGFGLLADHDITAAHYLVALAAIIPVGNEHMVASTQEAPITRARLGLFASAATTVLVLVAYAIAESR